ncbi:MAG TPA: hypothetical protein VNX27_02445 [Chthoniobacterales bacterium]|jgi:4-amino-4-deoxy-L-arabinose transferase-like glycosyltransferase|nr:hypothetical protein [Chthoniobacterales bacterium]
MGKLKDFLPVAALIGFCALIFAMRLHTYDEPLERDLTTYAVIAHEMLNGKHLYSELWDHKPPAIHVTYATAELIAGYGRNSIFLMNVVAAMATLIACYFAGGSDGRGPLGGLIAAGLWTLVSGDLAIQGNQPNTEVFLNAFLTSAFAIFACSKNSQLGFARAFLVGALFAVASFYKQIVVVQAGLISVAYIFCVTRDYRKKALAEIGIIAATGAAAWAALFGYFFAVGRSDAFIEAVFTYNRWYSARPPREVNELWNWPGLSPDALAVAFTIAALAFVGLVIGLWKEVRRGWALLLAFAIASYITVQLPGWFFPHYYQLWLPPLVIAAGWGIELLRRVLPARFSWSAYALASVCCVVLIVMEVPCYFIPAKGWSLQKYGKIFLEADRLAMRIDHMLPRDRSLFEWGNETGFYFTTRRDPPSGLIFAYPAQAGPLAQQLSSRLLDELKSKQPDVVIAAQLTMAMTPRHPVAIWIRENYRPFLETQSFLVMVRKGSELDRNPPIAAN